MLLWESKMCRLAWQLLGMLGNVLGRPRHALQCPRHALQRLRHAWQRPRRPWHVFLQGPRSPTSKKNSPTCCLISCEAKKIVYHQASIYETWFTVYTFQLLPIVFLKQTKRNY